MHLSEWESLTLCSLLLGLMDLVKDTPMHEALPGLLCWLPVFFGKPASSASVAGGMTSRVLPSNEETQSLRLKLARLHAVRICNHGQRTESQPFCCACLLQISIFRFASCSWLPSG